MGAYDNKLCALSPCVMKMNELLLPKVEGKVISINLRDLMTPSIFIPKTTPKPAPFFRSFPK